LDIRELISLAFDLESSSTLALASLRSRLTLSKSSR
jgi:hypothetical protein